MARALTLLGKAPIFNHMVERQSDLDQTFAALSDPTRRAILARLRAGSATVGEVADPFDMSLHGVSKHVQVLERAGLVSREIRGREHHLRLCAAPLEHAADYTQQYRAFWEARLDALAAHVEDRTGNPKPARPRSARRPPKKTTGRKPS